MILVTAGHGNMAREVIPKLAAAGHRVRAMRATPGRDEALIALGATEIAIGDLRNPEDIARAAEGCSAIYHICPGGLAYWERAIGQAVIDAAIRHEVAHVVVSTLLHPIVSSLLQHASKRDVEERLVESPVNWTILQPCDYMQTQLTPSTFRTGELPVSYGWKRRHSSVDLQDVADVAVRVLSEGAPHFFARYELVGLPRSFDAYELAAIAARVSGREVVVKPVSGPKFMRIWAKEEGPPIGSAHGMDDPAGRAFAREVLVAIERWYGEHDYVGNPNVLTWLLGRPPTSLEAYVERLYARTMAAVPQ